MARRAGRIAALAGLLLVLTGGGAAAAPSGERQSELLHRLKHDCGSCHGMTLKGGLGPPLLPASLADKGDAALIATILEGIKGTPMPPWGGELSEGEAAWLVDVLRRGELP